ncbi:unannotated protein [freshwater metagenome]|uniref:Unannotated protein n=1 Tax=freshwater metagenome TaxID=449393 RepID=A0A6J6HFQ8_9ZZZZ|nr:uridine diphosphate-N-acetylglucosamine-binding protein YvcK [Actinomycetota bacterium]MSZ54178.1 uridine diphosphate-N-acetylglucosamine-binding protein YvcK [Actinomycetota bacterium]
MSTKVVCLGGGHGLAATLSAMRNVTKDVTAIVTVADNGGSSGRLRAEFNSLPPGDLRMALAALCSDDDWGRSWAEIMQYRFTSAGEMDNHAIGNLLLTALWDRDGDPVKGLERVGDLLQVVGRVLPMALEPLDIEGTFELNGESKTIRGQIEVAAAKGEVIQLRIIPESPKSTPEALSVIEQADWITFGPGSWLSSVMPHLLLKEQAAAISKSKAKKILIFNLPDPTTSEEYAGSSLTDHLQFILKHLPDFKFDFALVDHRIATNNSAFESLVKKCGGKVVSFDLADNVHTFHHDSKKLFSAFGHILQPNLIR